jgi:hypothetical protein
MSVLALFVGSVYLVPRIEFRFAKAKAQKELLSGKTADQIAYKNAELNSIPQFPPKKIVPSIDYTNTIWLTQPGCDFGFPADRFTRDSQTNRQNVELHGAKYRMLVHPGSEPDEWETAMQFVNETNLFEFSRRAFNTTKDDIDRAPNKYALQRCLFMLQAKAMLAAVGYTDSCIEFDRGDLKGFIIGDPQRRKYVYIRVYYSGGRKYIDISVIQEKHIQLSDLEQLISTIKARYSN